MISPFLHHNMLKVRLLARDWASRTPTALAEVDELLGNAGLDREAIYAQILADKLDVIERIDLMIFRAEQRRNAALHMISNGGDRSVAERLHQHGTFLPQLPRGAQIDPDRASWILTGETHGEARGPSLQPAKRRSQRTPCDTGSRFLPDLIRR